MSTEEPGGGQPEKQMPDAGQTPVSPEPPIPSQAPMAPPPVMNQPVPGPMSTPPPDGGWGTPVTPDVMMPPPKKSNSGVIIGVVLALVIAIGAGAYFLTKSSSSTKTVSLPEEVSGVPRMHDATAEQLTQQFESSEFAGVKFKAALYGEGSPGLIVMATDGSPDLDVKSGFDEFLTGFTSTSQATIDESSKVDETRGGIDIACVSIDISGVPGTVCVWADSNVFGAVIDFRSDDSSAAVDVTEQVAQAVVS